MQGNARTQIFNWKFCILHFVIWVQNMTGDYFKEVSSLWNYKPALKYSSLSKLVKVFYYEVSFLSLKVDWSTDFQKWASFASELLFKVSSLLSEMFVTTDLFLCYLVCLCLRQSFVRNVIHLPYLGWIENWKIELLMVCLWHTSVWHLWRQKVLVYHCDVMYREECSIGCGT